MPTIQEVMDEYRVPYDSTGKGKNRLGWLNFRCCYCGRDPYLGYSIDGGGWSCWNCGKHRGPETVSMLTGMPIDEAQKLCKVIPRNLAAIKEHKKAGGKLILPNDLGPLQSAHKKYLASRNLDPDLMEKLWGLQGIGKLGGRLAWRIFIPVHVNGEIVTWTTRRLTNHEPRYWSAKPEQSIIPIDECIYGIDYCRTSIVCVEGPGDVWAIGPGAGCPFGLRVSDKQLELLSRFSLRGVLIDSGDAEKEAQRRAKRLADKLCVMEGQTLRLSLTSGKDPGACEEWERQEIRSLVQ